MILTTKSRYAVMAIVEVAASGIKKPVKLSSISDNQSISHSYLEQIFFKLKKANIVISIKGPGGGYQLKSSSKLITIEQILDAMDENLKMTRCSTDQKCRKAGIKCQTHNLWRGFSQQIRNYFSNISVADIVEGKVNI